MTREEIIKVVMAMRKYVEDHKDWKHHESELIANRLINQGYLK